MHRKVSHLWSCIQDIKHNPPWSCPNHTAGGLPVLYGSDGADSIFDDVMCGDVIMDSVSDAPDGH